MLPHFRFSTLALFGLMTSLPLCTMAQPKQGGSWIWSSAKAADDDKATFVKEFEVAAPLKAAQLRVSCDNNAIVYLNDKALGENLSWEQPLSLNVKDKLVAGKNTLRVEAKNEGGVAALMLSLKMTGQDNKSSEITSDATWLVKPAAGAGDAKPAVVIAAYGAEPWGEIFDSKKTAQGAGSVLAPDEVVVAKGFTVELLYTVPKNEQGSWVSMTVDPQGRLLTGDQYGEIYRMTPAPIGAKDGVNAVEKLSLDIGGAHGLLYAFNSLYVMVNENGPGKKKPGLYRLKDKDGQGNFDKPELLRAIDGGGEHGPHSIILSPDGKSLYICCGNHTKLPDHMEKSRAAMNSWTEDHILPRMWDANGHAKGILAPGAYVCKVDPEGKTFEMLTSGYRNIFDISVDQNGDVFTYDSDMEWDMGAPWYRPTRICLGTSGSDLGWRSGSGKWPNYYPDSLPPVLDIGPGSPTGTVFGTGAKFPAKYQRAFFAADWTYGTMYAVHLIPDGGGYRAEKEEFISGKPLPLTDMIIHPKDGAMYFAVGGRKSQSGVYRVHYTGGEPTVPVAAVPLTAEGRLRHDLEKLHLDGTGPDAVSKAGQQLGHPDRWVRYAARVALERQPASLWADKVLALTEPTAVLEGMIALARRGDKALQPQLLAKLSQLSYAKLPEDKKLVLLRAYDLAFLRMGKPSPEVSAPIAALLDGLYPSKNDFENRELAQLLIFLDSPKVVAKTVQLMSMAREMEGGEKASDELLNRNIGYASALKSTAESRPNRQQMAFAFYLRNAKTGWTPELRKTFFNWFPQARLYQGGNSLKGFIENIRKESLATVSDPAEMAALDALSQKQLESAYAMPNITPVKGPGKNYTVEQVVALAKDKMTGRNFESGANLYKAAGCYACHRFNGEGGGLGPDLTGSGNRYTINDLLENIVEPSKVISDQYQSHQIETKSGALMIGRIIVEENGKVFIAQNPLAPSETTAVNESEIKKKEVFPVSMMPPGMINSMNENEVLDLIAFLQSGGNKDDKRFQK